MIFVKAKEVVSSSLPTRKEKTDVGGLSFLSDTKQVVADEYAEIMNDTDDESWSVVGHHILITKRRQRSPPHPIETR